MKITNHAQLPLPIIWALEDAHEAYDGPEADAPDTISATSLIGPAQKAGILRLHADEVTLEAGDALWALMGAALHDVLYRAAVSRGQTGAEVRITVPCEGWVVSGRFDLFMGGTLTDYKVSTTWNWTHEATIREWEAQLNVYAWLARQHGFDVRALEVQAFLRDWKAYGPGSRDPDYPRVAMPSKPLPLWPAAEADYFVRHRVELHQQAAADPASVPCTPEERWMNAKGLPVRCQKYCAARPWCEQAKL